MSTASRPAGATDSTSPSGPAGAWWGVVLHFGSVERTAACVASLDPLGFAHVVLVDNGSGAPELDGLAAGRPWLRLVRNADNLGYAAGNNVGLRLALAKGAGFVAVLNNDVVVEYPGMLADAASCFQAHGRLGVMSPQVFYLARDWRELPVGSRFQRMLLRAADRDRGDAAPALPPPLRETDTFAGCSWMAPARVLAEVGLLREELFLYHEEVDLAVRLRRAGLRCGQVGAGKGRVLHYGSTARGHSPAQAYYCGRNAVLLLDGFPRSQRARLLAGATAYVTRMSLRCVSAGRVGSAVASWQGYVAGLRGKRGSR